MKEITLEARGENVRVLTDWADAELEQLGTELKMTDYGQYLLSLVHGN